MECGFAEDSAELGVCAGIEETNADIFRGETRSADERSIAFAVALKIEIGAGVDERVDQRQLGAAF